MIVLGIHAFIHDSGAAIVRDGAVCAISEERLDRVKRSAAPPLRSAGYVLAAAGLNDINEVDLVVYDLFEKQGRETLEFIRDIGYKGRVEAVCHHDAHAAAAYFASPFDEAAVMIVDGAGSGGDERPPGEPPHPLAKKLGWMQEVQSFYLAKRNSIELVRRTYATPDRAFGLGFVYGIACEYLGFDKLDGGKLMGLASYGRPSGKFKPGLFRDFDGDILVPFEREKLLSGDWKYLERKLFPGTPKRKPGGRILQVHKDAAYFIQKETEEAMLRMAAALRAGTGAKNLCLSGGVVLNGAANMLIEKKAGFDRIFIQPAANDAGIPLGCALHGYHVLLGGKKRYRMKDAFLGRAYSEKAIKDALAAEKQRVRAEKRKDAADVAARAIAEGKIVGLFDGAGEYGPRALGARSILADPRDPDMKDRLNATVKFREPFRPYAPAVLAKRSTEFFEPRTDSPFMLKIADAKPEVAKRIPAVVHVDGTARLQTVDAGRPAMLREIITEFDRLTGVPMVLNTSMNVSGEPIVETPAYAVRCLLGTGMDMLFIGGYVVVKKTGGI